jgi:hypothetical protein
MPTDLDVSVMCVSFCLFIIFTFRVILFKILSFFKFSCFLIGKKFCYLDEDRYLVIVLIESS